MSNDVKITLQVPERSNDKTDTKNNYIIAFFFFVGWGAWGGEGYFQIGELIKKKCNSV